MLVCSKQLVDLEVKAAATPSWKPQNLGRPTFVQVEKSLFLCMPIYISVHSEKGSSFIQIYARNIIITKKKIIN